jgi:hypothetical protein
MVIALNILFTPIEILTVAIYIKKFFQGYSLLITDYSFLSQSVSAFNDPPRATHY